VRYREKQIYIARKRATVKERVGDTDREREIEEKSEEESENPNLRLRLQNYGYVCDMCSRTEFSSLELFL